MRLACGERESQINHRLVMTTQCGGMRNAVGALICRDGSLPIYFPAVSASMIRHAQIRFRAFISLSRGPLTAFPLFFLLPATALIEGKNCPRCSISHSPSSPACVLPARCFPWLRCLCSISSFPSARFFQMIPLWMFPMGIATGNTYLLKPSERTPGASPPSARLGAGRGRARARTPSDVDGSSWRGLTQKGKDTSAAATARLAMGEQQSATV